MITPGTAQYTQQCTGAGFFTYTAFITAAAAFPTFGSSSPDAAVNMREIAAFLGQASQETNGAALDAYTGGLCYTEEGGSTPTLASYCVPSTQYPCAAGKSYRGRGPLQLSYNFNYGAAGPALGLNLLADPDTLARDPVASFEASLWFWVTPSSAGTPSCHTAMTGEWVPSASDAQAGRTPGYGAVTNIINGGVLQCGDGSAVRSPAEVQKIGYFNAYEAAFGLPQSTDPATVTCAYQQHY